MRIQFLFIIFISIGNSQESYPSEFWYSYSQEEKIAFINGVYGSIEKIKKHHESELKKQYVHDSNYIQPYFIERFYIITDEYRSEKIGYNLNVIAMHMDAFYTNSDNQKIPVLDALRIVSLIQDGEQKTANLRLLRMQKKYK